MLKWLWQMVADFQRRREANRLLRMEARQKEYAERAFTALRKACEQNPVHSQAQGDVGALGVRFTRQAVDVHIICVATGDKDGARHPLKRRVALYFTLRYGQDKISYLRPGSEFEEGGVRDFKRLLKEACRIVRDYRA